MKLDFKDYFLKIDIGNFIVFGMPSRHVIVLTSCICFMEKDESKM